MVILLRWFTDYSYISICSTNYNWWITLSNAVVGLTVTSSSYTMWSKGQRHLGQYAPFSPFLGHECALCRPICRTVVDYLSCWSIRYSRKRRHSVLRCGCTVLGAWFTCMTFCAYSTCFTTLLSPPVQVINIMTARGGAVYTGGSKPTRRG